MRKIGPYPDQSQGGEGICGVFHPAQHRQTHLGDGDMRQLVQQHEQHIAGHELREPLNVLRRSALEFRVVLAKRKGRRVDPGLKWFDASLRRRFKWNRWLGG
jgi:hypothetical protein